MELQNTQFIEIISTLEMIDRANKAIEFHSKSESPDLLAIKQYESLRTDYMLQLNKLFQNFQIEACRPEIYNVPQSFFQQETFNIYANH